jgi:TolB-like protein
MKRLVMICVVSVAAMLGLSACSATPPGQAMVPEDGPPLSAHPPRVVVFPFAPTGSVGAYDWIGRGIQQSLVADLSRSGTAQVVFPTTQPAGERVNRMQMAAEAGANAVVVGTYQVNDGEVRVTGEVFDVGSGRNLGGIKATGPVNDLFKLEDELNEQLERVLPSSYAAASEGDGRLTPPAPAVDSPAAQAPLSAGVSPATSQPASVRIIAPPQATPIPDITYNYYNAAPPVTSPPPDYVYEDPYYDPDYYDAPYYYGAWPFYGYVGVGVYGPGFYHGYGYRGYGYHGYGPRGVERPFFGIPHNGGGAGGGPGRGFGGGGGGGGGGHR